MSNMAASGEDVVGGDIERQKTIEVDEGIDELLSVLCHRTNVLKILKIYGKLMKVR